MRGSTGRRRLDYKELEKRLVPDVSTERQREIEETLVSASLKRDQILLTIETLIKETDKRIKEMINNSTSFAGEDNAKKTVQKTL